MFEIFEFLTFSSDPEYTKKLCDTWPQKYEPTLSSFHPSAMILASKLRNSTNVINLFEISCPYSYDQVKRELQLNEYESQQAQAASDDIFASYWEEEPEEKEQEEVVQPKVELKEDLQTHVFKSMEYYAFVNIPLLGLVFYMEHKEGLEINDSK